VEFARLANAGQHSEHEDVGEIVVMEVVDPKQAPGFVVGNGGVELDLVALRNGDRKTARDDLALEREELLHRQEDGELTFN